MAKNSEPSAAKEKFKSFLEKLGTVRDGTNTVLGIAGNVLFHLRKLFLAVPVILVGMRVFMYAKENLPNQVGVLLEESGAFRYMLDRDTAMACCLYLTGGCLLMMFLSRKVIYPWIISLFSLVLPIVLVVTNLFLG